MRAGYLASAGMYVVLGLTALKLTQRQKESTNGNRSVQDVAGKLMGNGVGRWAIGFVGLILIAAGIYRVWKGVRDQRDDELDLSGMSEPRQRTTRFLGTVGEIGRGTAIALVGFFLARAAIDYNADEATGLDGALRVLADDWWGAIIIAIIGLGFVAYGVYCITTWNRRKLKPAA
jgi:hypothetical protein